MEVIIGLSRKYDDMHDSGHRHEGRSAKSLKDICKAVSHKYRPI